MLSYELQTYYWTGMCVESYIPVRSQNLSEIVLFRAVICHPLHLLSLAVCVSRALCWELCSERGFRLVGGAGVLVLALEWPRATVAEVELDCCRCLENKATRGGGGTRSCRPFWCCCLHCSGVLCWSEVAFCLASLRRWSHMIHMHGFSSDNVVREKPHLQSRGDTTKMKVVCSANMLRFFWSLCFSLLFSNMMQLKCKPELAG